MGGRSGHAGRHLRNAQVEVGEAFGNEVCDLLVPDEASPMNLPEAVKSALPIKPDAPLIIVGDHCQLPWCRTGRSERHSSSRSRNSASSTPPRGSRRGRPSTQWSASRAASERSAW